MCLVLGALQQTPRLTTHLKQWLDMACLQALHDMLPTFIILIMEAVCQVRLTITWEAISNLPYISPCIAKTTLTSKNPLIFTLALLPIRMLLALHWMEAFNLPQITMGSSTSNSSSSSNSRGITPITIVKLWDRVLQAASTQISNYKLKRIENCFNLSSK